LAVRSTCHQKGIQKSGFGSALPDFKTVADPFDLFVQSALETPCGSVVVDLPSQLATTEKFVNMIDHVVPGAGLRLKIDGPAIPSNIPPKPHYISELSPDWRTTTLEEGVRRTVDFCRNRT